jgi:hypothetical protein
VRISRHCRLFPAALSYTQHCMLGTCCVSGISPLTTDTCIHHRFVWGKRDKQAGKKTKRVETLREKERRFAEVEKLRRLREEREEEKKMMEARSLLKDAYLHLYIPMYTHYASTVYLALLHYLHHPHTLCGCFRLQGFSGSARMPLLRLYRPRRWRTAST